MIPQEHSVGTKVVNKHRGSINHFSYLTRVVLTCAHVDYINEFLCQTKSYVPRLSLLEIDYERLVIVTNNFTNQLTRINCA